MDNATQWVIDHRKRIMTNISSAVMMLIIFGLFGAFDFFTMKFDFAKLKDIAYWSHILARVVGLICAFNIGVNMFEPYAINANAGLQKDMARNNELSSMRTDSFEPFIIHEFNPAEKKKAWLSDVNARINRITRHAKDRSRMLWGDKSEKAAELRSKDRYCRKREMLERMKTDEWIEGNIDTINAKGFVPVDPTTFNLSIDGKPSYRGKKTTSNTAGARSLKTSSLILSTLVISMFTTIWSLNLSDAVASGELAKMWENIINFALDIGFLLGKFAQGVMYAGKMVENEIHKPYADRNDILIAYYKSQYSPIGDIDSRIKEINERAEKATNDARQEAKRKADDKRRLKLARLEESERTRNDLRGLQ